MREILRDLPRYVAERGELAYCRLVETRGSTPQKAGAVMLVFADGSQVGTLGGGCVEAEVKRQSLAVLAAGGPRIERFQLDSDYGWDDGLICGGRMTALIDALRTPLDPYFAQLAELAAGGGGSEAVVFDAAAAQLPEATSFLFDDAHQLRGVRGAKPDVGGAASPATAPTDMVLANLRPLVERPRPYAAQGVGYLPLLPRCRLVVVGGGHVGQAVGNLAAQLDFDVWVVDDRADIVSPERFPAAERRLVGPVDQVLPQLDITPNTYCLIVTRGHHHDEQALYYLAERGARYVGLIGSRRKIKMIFDDLLAEGISAAALERVHAPVGVDIGSQTVPEIAISICAELVAHRNLGGAVPGRPANVAVNAPGAARVE